VRPFNFLLSFQIHPLADGEADATPVKSRLSLPLTKISPVAPYDTDPFKAAKKCFDRGTGKRVPINQLQTYREALAQYHLYPENKFLNAQHRDRGCTQRRHVTIDVTDVHYVGKEANELEEQAFLGFDPEAQPEYGMESESYVKLAAAAKGALFSYDLTAASIATGVSTRYLRRIRDGSPNVTFDILKRIGNAIPLLEAAHIHAVANEDHLLDWTRAEPARVGLRKLAGRLDIDPANLSKVLARRRRATRGLLASIMKQMPQA
jgi:hypothetical protein